MKGNDDNTWEPRNKTTYNYNYNYNPAGKPHAPVQIGTATYTYDAGGNQTGFRDDVSAQRRLIEWDEENRIKTITDNGVLFRYAYDASGHRVLKSLGQGQKIRVNGKLVNDTTKGLGNFKIYVNPYMEVRSGSFTKHFYIEGGRITSKYIAGTNPPNNLEFFQFYFHSDHVGNSSFITDRLGEVYQHLEYFPFGETFIDEHGNQERTRYLYNGKELDDETRLYYYGARYYDARTSLWESVDPLINKDNNMSPYVYCNNNPIKMNDPDGRSGEAVINKSTKTITVTQTLIFYGGAATKERSTKIAKGIQDAWNAANAKVKVNANGDVNPSKGGVEYKVVFIVESKTVSEAVATKMAEQNKDVKNNFIRVENGGSADPSKYSVEGVDGGNGGWFNTNQPVETTTGAHEIGHGYGLGHDDHFDASKGQAPDIMVPLSDTKDKGASRRVTDKDVLTILQGGFTKGVRKIGKATNPIFNAGGVQTSGKGKLSDDSK